MTGIRTIRTYRDGDLIASRTVTTTTDWQATPPTVTVTVTDDATGNVLATETREQTAREIAHHQIVQTWGQRRAALLAAYGALSDAAPDIIAANQAVQAASTTAQMSAAVKAYASANLTALGAIKDALDATRGAWGVTEDALAWLDGELADLREEAGA